MFQLLSLRFSDEQLGLVWPRLTLFSDGISSGLLYSYIICIFNGIENLVVK